MSTDELDVAAGRVGSRGSRGAAGGKRHTLVSGWGRWRNPIH